MNAPKVDVLAELDALIIIRASRAARDNAPITAIGDLQRAEATRTAVAELIEASKAISPYIATQVLEHCNGNKCREPWCAGCCGEEEAEASVEKANEAYRALNNALNRIVGAA